MTGEAIRTMAETILEDSVDEVLFYQLVNVAKNNVEDARPWMFLRTLDSSKTAVANTPIALPTSWRRTYKLMVGTDMVYTQVPFDEQHLYRNTSGRYLVDVASSTYTLLGTIGRSDTVYNYYIKSTADIASGTSLVWPDRFHPILAYEVAGYVMMGVDADDVFARMSPENKVAAQTLRNSMEAWDSRLQMDAQNNQIQVAHEITGINVGMM